MGKEKPATLLEKIFRSHSSVEAPTPGQVIDLALDARVARDFGGANVIGHLERHNLVPGKREGLFFTFDCNPSGSDQGYAANQHRLRLFARKWGIKVFDINQGIGTHLAIERGFAWPGSTLVSTDSHANILGAIGAFGQGMGDMDIARAFDSGSIWFQVPPTVKVVLKGQIGPFATPKDVGLALLKHFGAAGLLGKVAELTGPVVESLSFDARMTVASLATEMGAISLLIPPSPEMLKSFPNSRRSELGPDPGCKYDDVIEINLDGLGPLVARPGHPEDVVPLAEVQGEPVDSAFIGSCTNGRLSDMQAAAALLLGRTVAPHVVLKVVPATDRIWQQALADGLILEFKRAGALVANAGCAGCAAGQVGQNGPGEVTVSTGNRNFAGKQGQGQVYLASPAVAAASAVAGYLTHPDQIPTKPRTVAFTAPRRTEKKAESPKELPKPPITVEGRAWVIPLKNIDTDMIYHNRHLAVTDTAEMGQYAFGNLEGWQHFAREVKPGDLLVTGGNFGAGSSRQQAVDCFKTLGVAALLAPSFGAIYERNAINSAFPLLRVDLLESGVTDGEQLRVDFITGEVWRLDKDLKISGRPMEPVPLAIYRRGGLLEPEREEK